MLQFKHLFTLAIGGALSVAPMLLPAVPAPYNIIASSAIATLTGLYHLYQPQP